MKRIFSKIKIKVYPKNIIDSINFLTRNYPLIFYWDYEKNWGDSINEFIFNSILFRKIQKNRSRTLCLNMENNRQYLISNQALVLIIVE